MENTTKNTSTSFQMDPPTDSSSIARKENETEHDSPNPNDSLEKIPRDFQQSAVQRLNTLASDCAQNAKGIFSPEPQASVAENNVTGTMKTGSAIAREETKQDETSSTVLGSARGALSPQCNKSKISNTHPTQPHWIVDDTDKIKPAAGFTPEEVWDGARETVGDTTQYRFRIKIPSIYPHSRVSYLKISASAKTPKAPGITRKAESSIVATVTTEEGKKHTANLDLRDLHEGLQQPHPQIETAESLPNQSNPDSLVTVTFQVKNDFTATTVEKEEKEKSDEATTVEKAEKEKSDEATPVPTSPKTVPQVQASTSGGAQLAVPVTTSDANSTSMLEDSSPVQQPPPGGGDALVSKTDSENFSSPASPLVGTSSLAPGDVGNGRAIPIVQHCPGCRCEPPE